MFSNVFRTIIRLKGLKSVLKYQTNIFYLLNLLVSLLHIFTDQANVHFIWVVIHIWYHVVFSSNAYICIVVRQGGITLSIGEGGDLINLAIDLIVPVPDHDLDFHLHMSSFYVQWFEVTVGHVVDIVWILYLDSPVQRTTPTKVASVNCAGPITNIQCILPLGRDGNVHCLYGRFHEFTTCEHDLESSEEICFYPIYDIILLPWQSKLSTHRPITIAHIWMHDYYL